MTVAHNPTPTLRALDVVARLADGPLPTAEVLPGVGDYQTERALTLARRAGLVRPDGGRWVLTCFGRVAVGRLGGA